MRTRRLLSLLSIVASLSVLPLHAELKVEPSKHDLQFKDLAQVWDEALPLGNAVVGALLWEKGGNVRMSLDRVDLWDLRPVDTFKGEKFSFKWIYDRVMNGNYGEVHPVYDSVYDNSAAPSKIPGAAMEFDSSKMGKVKNSRLYLNNAVAEVEWENGAKMQSFVDAHKPVGWFIVEGADESFIPSLLPPNYDPKNSGGSNGPGGMGLGSLGYKQGEIKKDGDKIVYTQPGWDDFSYEVAVKWKRDGDKLIGVWSVTSSLVDEKASDLVDKALVIGEEKEYDAHNAWWKNFWSKSSVSIPDPVIEKQYFNDIYKLGSVTRKNGYPISLQAVWTADNGTLPPWKGDYHHDLNTQLSAWPCYTGNYVDEGMGYINTLWDQREENKKFTKQFYGTDGVNVPGVADLHGKPMGGWPQYSFSPTTSGWLAHHFYLHWQYSQDKDWLKKKGYPYMKDVATHLEQFSELKDGVRALPLSTSPEIHNNSVHAWFKTMTNYDLGIMKFVFASAAEMASELGLKEEAQRWTKDLNELGDFDLDAEQGLTFAKDQPYAESHRHFSNALGFHPLGVIDYSKGEKDKAIIDETINKLEKVGPAWWCGYSYSWFANMLARAFDGDKAAQYLRDFANCFVLRSTFHCNGDQSGTKKSNFTYRPFTLEGNFAFASGLQEMLIQSHTGVIRVFPAIPSDWKDASFKTLRTYGAFLVSAERKDGKTDTVTITSEKGGTFKLFNPFVGADYTAKGGKVKAEGDLLIGTLKPGESVTLTRK